MDLSNLCFRINPNISQFTYFTCYLTVVMTDESDETKQRVQYKTGTVLDRLLTIYYYLLFLILI